MSIISPGSLRREALATLVVCVVAMATATSASAAPGHAFAGFVSTPVVGGVAVDQATGDVYVADANGISEVSSGTAETFVSGGSFSQLAADGDAGIVYAIDPSVPAVNRYDSTGAALAPLDGSLSPAAFFNPTAIAGDPSTGNVFVANVDPNGESAPVIEVFDDTGGFVGEIAGPAEAPFSSPSGMAIDGSDHLYVLDGGTVNRYSTAGAFETVFAGDAVAVAADPSSDDVYVATSSQIVNYSSAGTILFTFATGDVSAVSGLAVIGSSSQVWVADQTASGVLFYDAVLAPDVTIGPAVATSDSAELSGTVDPLGEATTYRFDWGIESTSENSTDPVDAGSGSGPVPAAATLNGLLPNQEYRYQLVATGLIANFGDVATFTTEAIPPLVTTGIATNVTRINARIRGTVNPKNSKTTYSVEYGTSTAYGEATTPVELAPSMDDQAVESSLTGLEPATTYHYRMTADNQTGGTQVGIDRTFTTLDPLPGVTVALPTDVTKSSATFHGTVDNLGFPVTYRFTVIGTDSAYVTSTPDVTLPPASGAQAVTGSLSDLPAGSGFEVRVVATSSGGTSVSAPIGFRTPDAGLVPPPPPPLIDVAPYGCGSPHLNAHPGKVRPGRTITLTGSDLGVGGTVTFGSSMADADSWSANAIRVVVPDDARGSAAVKVDCSRESNTIKVAIQKAAAKKKAKAKSCKRGYVKKKVKGKTRCVKKKAAAKGRRG